MKYDLDLVYDLVKQPLLNAYHLMMVNILISYKKFLQLIKELWTVQAISSQFTLNYDLDHGPSQMVLVHCTEHYGNAHTIVKFPVIST